MVLPGLGLAFSGVRVGKTAPVLMARLFGFQPRRVRTFRANPRIGAFLAKFFAVEVHAGHPPEVIDTGCGCHQSHPRQPQ